MRRLVRLIRKRKAALLAFGLILSAGLLYTFGPNILNELSRANGAAPSEDGLSSRFATRARLANSICTFWFFLVGTTIGSFVNVVVYRLPKGQSFLIKPSHCPYCKTAIRIYHNLPIFGWLWLNGRCRRCRLPISFQYPLVELLYGLAFLLLVFIQLASGGQNLPIRPMDESRGIVQDIAYPNWELIRLTLFHLLMITGLFASSMIQFKGQTVPFRFWVTLYVLAWIWCIALPETLLVHWGVPWVDASPIARRSDAFASMFVGGAIGAIFGTLLCFLVTSPSGNERILIRGKTIPFGLGLAGSFLGWQAAIPIALMCMGLGFAFLFLKPGRFSGLPWLALLTISAYVHHLFWRHLFVVIFVDRLQVTSPF